MPQVASKPSILLSAAMMCCTAIPLAAQSANEQATIQALLTEVRQLRLALEQSALIAPKMQIALQKMQMQHTRVDQISQRLHDLRSKLSGVASEEARLAADLRQAQTRLSQEQEPVRRKELELHVEHLKHISEEIATRNPQQRAQEVELTGQLRFEQAKFDEISVQLGALESSLNAVKPSSTPPIK